MIASLTGTVEEYTGSGVVLNVGGIGFEVQTSADAMQILSAKGSSETVHLYTYMNTGREGDLSLYGFLSRDELRLFKMLITVSGIGPKGALGLLSSMSADDLIFAILTGDTKSISRAQGVGKKTAERLVLELKDKLAQGQDKNTGLGGDSVETSASGAALNLSSGGSLDPSIGNTAASDAAQALTALGYARAEAVKAVRKAQEELLKKEDGSADNTEELLRSALRYLG